MKRFILVAAAALSLAACDNSDQLTNNEVNQAESNEVISLDECDENKLGPHEHCK